MPESGVGEAAGDEVGRELASRRRDLEREFDDKARELKAQHKRQADKLAQDRVEWEAHRREQQRELADRAEKVRRSEDNHKRDLDALKAARAELEAAKGELAEQRILRAEVKQAAAVKEAASDGLRAAHGLLATAAFVAVGGLGATALLLALGEQAVALGVAVAGLLGAVGVELRRRRMRRAHATERAESR